MQAESTADEAVTEHVTESGVHSVFPNNTYPEPAPPRRSPRVRRKRSAVKRLSQDDLIWRMYAKRVHVPNEVLGRYVREVLKLHVSLRDYLDALVEEKRRQGELSTRDNERLQLIRLVNIALFANSASWDGERSHNGHEVRRVKNGRQTFCFLICTLRGVIVTFHELTAYRRSQRNRRARRRDHLNRQFDSR